MRTRSNTTDRGRTSAFSAKVLLHPQDAVRLFNEGTLRTLTVRDDDPVEVEVEVEGHAQAIYVAREDLGEVVRAPGVVIYTGREPNRPPDDYAPAVWECRLNGQSATRSQLDVVLAHAFGPHLAEFQRYMAMLDERGGGR